MVITPAEPYGTHAYKRQSDEMAITAIRNSRPRFGPQEPHKCCFAATVQFPIRLQLSDLNAFSVYTNYRLHSGRPGNQLFMGC